MSQAPGKIHPMNVALREIATLFGRMGFSVAGGPELEDEHYNFDVLRVPADHPARDMQDTFWIKGMPGKVLRTQTSPVQVRYMESQVKRGIMPPYRIIVPGKVFRNEATDATHEAQFYQNEGLCVGEGVTLAHLQGTLEQFFKEYLGDGAKVRFRPSFFPFVEPAVEVDVWFAAKNKWLEVMGAGMVHPEVLSNAGIDPKKYQGWAFGGGVERLIMVKYGIPDVRLFHGGDLRFNYGFSESV